MSDTAQEPVQSNREMVSPADGYDQDFDLFQALELTKAYGETVAVNSINFRTSTRALGILGPNGCGKSTFLKLMLKLIKPTKGSIELNNRIKDIRVIPDYPYLPQELTIDEWMEMLEVFHGKLIHDVDIQRRLDLRGEWKIKDLSAGQYRKAALLPAFFGSPQLIILDEPTNFLDIVTREYVLQLLSKQIEDRGSRVILGSHRTDEIRLLADQAVILKNGSMVKSVDIFRHPIRSYEIIVEQEKLFLEHMKNDDINVTRTVVSGRNIYEIPNYPDVWRSLFNYTKDNGNVISLRSIDELDRNIEELLK